MVPLSLSFLHYTHTHTHTHTTQLLRKGDSFFVPPFNIYRLENHSKVDKVVLFWTIVKPLNQDHGEGEGEEGSSHEYDGRGDEGDEQDL